MSCIRQRRGKWVVDWRDSNGRRHWETKANKNEALLRLNEMRGHARRGTGSIYRRGAVYWVAYYRKGKLYRESSHSEEEQEARKLLNTRIHEALASEDRFVSMRSRTEARKVKFAFSDEARCEICRRLFNKPDIHWDHDHISGSFRGWLCRGCNQMLGNARDRVDVLLAAAQYLLKCDMD